MQIDLEIETLRKEVSHLKKEVAASNRRFFNIVEKNMEGIVVVGRHFEIVYLNPAAETLFGRKSEDLLGEYFGIPLETGHISDFKIFNPKRGDVFVEILVSNVRWEEQNAHLLTLRDITKRKEVETLLNSQKQELQRVNKELNTYVFTVSHDLRGPVRTMGSFAGLLKEEYGDVLKGEGLDYLNRMIRGSERIHNMMDNLLMYAKLGKKAHTKKEINMQEIAREAVDLLSKQIRETDAYIAIEGDFPLWMCNRNLMLQVFMNLISNALKYVAPEEKPEISIGTENKNGTHWVYVKDKGIGIKKEHLFKIFFLFSRLHSESSAYSGSGIGLSSFKKIIDLHEGKILAESTPGVGSTFYFSLDTKQEEVKEPGELFVEAHSPVLQTQHK